MVQSTGQDMGQDMGIVVDFPPRDAACASRRAVATGHSAQVVILPVIRIERYEEFPNGYFKPGRAEQGRKRKRRASRS